MPNIASALKQEISRVARKEVRGETAGLKKAAATYRSEIGALKRRAQALEQQIRKLTKARKDVLANDAGEDSPSASRFSAKGLASQRKRLGLSAADAGLLVGASSQSVYNWEQGKTRPLARHLPAIAALKGMGSARPPRGCKRCGSRSLHRRGVAATLRYRDASVSIVGQIARRKRGRSPELSD
jgi:DNA-binding XRE family transcriptional regulator